MGNIPYVWGSLDKNKDSWIEQKKIINNRELSYKNTKIDVDFNDINKNKGNYLKLKINSNYLTTGVIHLYHNDTKVGTLKLTIRKGEFDYVIRISSMYEWYEGDINNIRLRTDSKTNLVNMSILQGDTLND